MPIEESLVLVVTTSRRHRQSLITRDVVFVDEVESSFFFFSILRGRLSTSWSEVQYVRFSVETYEAYGCGGMMGVC